MKRAKITGITENEHSHEQRNSKQKGLLYLAVEKSYY